MFYIDGEGWDYTELDVWRNGVCNQFSILNRTAYGIAFMNPPNISLNDKYRDKYW